MDKKNYQRVIIVNAIWGIGIFVIGLVLLLDMALEWKLAFSRLESPVLEFFIAIILLLICAGGIGLATAKPR